MATSERERVRASLEALTARLEREDPETVEEIASAVIGSLDRYEPLDPGIWGPEPTPAEVAEAVAHGRSLEREQRDLVLADALTRAGVADRLRISSAAVSKKLAKRRLVALKQGREWRFPAWQFGEDGLLPGIDRVAEAHIGGVVGLSLWAVEPHPDLGGRTPREALAGGQVDRVALAALAITAHGW